MKKSIFIVFATLIFASGCVEKTGYYSDGEKSTISLICDSTWTSKEIINDEGYTHYTVYKFEKNGTYIRTFISIDTDGKKSENSVTGRWSFYDPGSKTIYFGDDHYWDIEELTTKKFAVYDRRGEYGQIHMTREYLELTPLK